MDTATCAFRHTQLDQLLADAIVKVLDEQFHGDIDIADSDVSSNAKSKYYADCWGWRPLTRPERDAFRQLTWKQLVEVQECPDDFYVEDDPDDAIYTLLGFITPDGDIIHYRVKCWSVLQLVKLGGQVTFPDVIKSDNLGE